MRLIFKRPIRLAGTIAASLFLLAAVFAEEGHANAKYAGLVVDHHTGEVLYSDNPDAPRYPASLTKMMTLYMVFDRLRTGELKLSDKMRVSSYAGSRPPSKLYLKPGTTITVEDGIRALVTKSANDAATVIAEHIGGTEANFGRMMTARAHELGMSRTTFKNPHGLPNSEQKTTARDMVTLGRALIDNHPDYYKYFNTRAFTYRGNRYGNHNRLLGRVEGVDGIKTGYTRASGFNLVSSLNKDGRHLVAVVMGGRTGASRDAHMRDLLQRTYARASINRNPDRTPLLIASATPVAANLPSAPLPPSIERVVAQVTQPDPDSVIGQRFTQAPTIEGIINSLPAHYAQMQGSQTPEVQVASASDTPVYIEQGDTTIEEKIVEASVVQQAAATGWMVQIGAFDNPNQAEAQLDKAQGSLKRQLADVSPVTQKFDRGDAMFYRARFAGFSTKQDAQNACSELKKQRFNCYAIYE